MSVKVSIEHRTEYAFDRPAELGPHEIRLRPAPPAAPPIGHTAGELPAPSVRRSSEYPRTLDLREAGYRRR